MSHCTTLGCSRYPPYYEYGAGSREDSYDRHKYDRVEAPIACDFHADLAVVRGTWFFASGPERIFGPVDACLFEECVYGGIEVAHGCGEGLVPCLHLCQFVPDGRCD